MLYVFFVNHGEFITFDMEFLYQNVILLKENIEKRLKIPIEKQILLNSNGQILLPKTKLAKYIAGTDISPIYLFSKRSNELIEPLPLVSNTDATESQLRDSANGAMDLMPSFQTVSVRSQLALRLYESSQENLERAEKLIHEQRHQHVAFIAAIINFGEIIIWYKKQMEFFNAALKHFVKNREHYLEILPTFDKALSLLEKLPVLTCLKSENFSNITDRSNISLLEWINATGGRSTEHTIQGIFEKCRKSIDQIKPEFRVETLKSATKLLKVTENDEMKVITGLDKRLISMEKLLEKFRKTVIDIKELALGLSQNEQRLKNTADKSVLPQLCSSHKEQLKMLLAQYDEVRVFKRRCTDAKNELICNLQARLKWLCEVEGRLEKQASEMIMFAQHSRNYSLQLTILTQIHEAPWLYVDVVIEVLRRRKFSSRYLKWARKLSSESMLLYKDEVEKRKATHKRLHKHFLESLFPGFNDAPVRFISETIDDFDEDLPVIEREHIEQLQKLVPELKDRLLIPSDSDDDDDSLFFIRPTSKQPEDDLAQGSCQLYQTPAPFESYQEDDIVTCLGNKNVRLDSTSSGIIRVPRMRSYSFNIIDDPNLNRCETISDDDSEFKSANFYIDDNCKLMSQSEITIESDSNKRLVSKRMEIENLMSSLIRSKSLTNLTQDKLDKAISMVKNETQFLKELYRDICSYVKSFKEEMKVHIQCVTTELLENIVQPIINDKVVVQEELELLKLKLSRFEESNLAKDNELLLESLNIDKREKIIEMLQNNNDELIIKLKTSEEKENNFSFAIVNLENDLLKKNEEIKTLENINSENMKIIDSLNVKVSKLGEKLLESEAGLEKNKYEQQDFCKKIKKFENIENINLEITTIKNNLENENENLKKEIIVLQTKNGDLCNQIKEIDLLNKRMEEKINRDQQIINDLNESLKYSCANENELKKTISNIEARCEEDISKIRLENETEKLNIEKEREKHHLAQLEILRKQLNLSGMEKNNLNDKLSEMEIEKNQQIEVLQEQIRILKESLKKEKTNKLLNRERLEKEKRDNLSEQQSFNDVVLKLTEEKDRIISSLMAESKNYSNSSSGILKEFKDAESITETLVPLPHMQTNMSDSAVLNLDMPDPAETQNSDSQSQWNDPILRRKLAETLIGSGLRDKIYICISQCSPGDLVLIGPNDFYNHYLLFLVNQPLHFVHNDCLPELGLKKYPKEKSCDKWVLGEIIDRDHCLARKATNRFNLPVGTKFYRVRVRRFNSDIQVPFLPIGKNCQVEEPSSPSSPAS